MIFDFPKINKKERKYQFACGYCGGKTQSWYRVKPSCRNDEECDMYFGFCKGKNKHILVSEDELNLKKECIETGKNLLSR